MKVNIIRGPRTDENIDKCYEYILSIHWKRKQKEAESNSRSLSHSPNLDYNNGKGNGGRGDERNGKTIFTKGNNA